MAALVAATAVEVVAGAVTVAVVAVVAAEATAVAAVVAVAGGAEATVEDAEAAVATGEVPGRPRAGAGERRGVRSTLALSSPRLVLRQPIVLRRSFLLT